MKVYISKYRDHWLSPYTILEKVLYWKDWENISYDTPWVEKWANRIEPFSKALSWFLDKIHPPINYVKIDYYDTWSMDCTLSPIIAPMLKQLQATKQGSPSVDDEDVPLPLRSTAPGARDRCENDWDTDEHFHDRWTYVMGEMIWAFEQLCKDDHDAQFWDHSHMDKNEKDLNKQLSQLKCDWDGLKKHQERIANGTRLFGKYYQALWD